jgi:hypothetical protein
MHRNLTCVLSFTQPAPDYCVPSELRAEVKHTVTACRSERAFVCLGKCRQQDYFKYYHIIVWGGSALTFLIAAVNGELESYNCTGLIFLEHRSGWVHG